MPKTKNSPKGGTFKLLRGYHNGFIARGLRQRFKKGDLVESPFDLERMYPTKFKRESDDFTPWPDDDQE